MSDTSQIEAYLLAQRAWVPVGLICERFGLKERRLRGLDGKPGLCSEFAISSDRGLKHVSVATTAEWIEFKHRLRKHGINELIRVASLGKRRSKVTCQTSCFVSEKDSGQGLLFPPIAAA